MSLARSIDGSISKGSGSFNLTFSLVNATQTVTVNLDKSMGSEDFTALAGIAKSCGMFGSVFVKEARGTSPTTVDVVLQSLAVLSNANIKLVVVGIGI